MLTKNKMPEVRMFLKKKREFQLFCSLPYFYKFISQFFLFLIDKNEKKIISPHRVHAITFLYSTHNIFMTSVIRDKPSHKSYITIHGYLNIRFFCNYCIVYVLLAIIVQPNEVCYRVQHSELNLFKKWQILDAFYLLKQFSSKSLSI